MYLSIAHSKLNNSFLMFHLSVIFFLSFLEIGVSNILIHTIFVLLSSWAQDEENVPSLPNPPTSPFTLVGDRDNTVIEGIFWARFIFCRVALRISSILLKNKKNEKKKIRIPVLEVNQSASKILNCIYWNLQRYLQLALGKSKSSVRRSRQ